MRCKGLARIIDITKTAVLRFAHHLPILQECLWIGSPVFLLRLCERLLTAFGSKLRGELWNNPSGRSIERDQGLSDCFRSALSESEGTEWRGRPGAILGTICMADEPEPITATFLSLKEYESSHLAECARCPPNSWIPSIAGHFQLLRSRSVHCSFVR